MAALLSLNAGLFTILLCSLYTALKHSIWPQEWWWRWRYNLVRSLLLSAEHLVLLSTARPTSPASDQTKGGVGRVYREHRGSVPETQERKIRSNEDTAGSRQGLGQRN